MNIKNETYWNTFDLKKLFTRCQNTVNQIEKTRNRHYTIYVKYSKKGTGLHGLGCYSYIKIFIPSDRDFSFSEERRHLAKLFIHEYYHAIGFKSQDRLNYRYDWTTKYNVDFADNYSIDKKVMIEKPKPDKQISRYQTVLVRIEEWTRQLKRAKKALTKYTAKKNRYEKILVAAGKIKL